MRRPLIALVALLAPLSIHAQVVHTRTAGGTVAAPAANPAPATTPRTATTAPAPRIAAIAPAPIVLFGFPNQGLFFTRGTTAFIAIPVVVVADGRVFADFGRGFEHIVNGCGGFVGFAGTSLQPIAQPNVTQPVVVQPTPGLPTAVATVPTVAPLPYTPPVPNQVTPSQQMLGGQPTVAFQSFAVNTVNCFSMNGNGQVFITRP